VGSCGHVLKCQVLNDAASQGPGASGLYSLPRPLGVFDWMPGPYPGSRREVGWVDRQRNPTCPRLS
jgi:hypothetical protein